MKNRFSEKPSLNNLSHIYELYEESGSEDKNIEVNKKGENKKNAKESSYTNTDRHKEKSKPSYQRMKNPSIIMKSQKNWEKEEALVTKEMALSNLVKNIFIGDSAAISHMTSNKMGVYSLVAINRSVMIGNGQRIICTHNGIGCHL